MCDQHNPCIDPAINEGNETDNRKLAKRLRNHFVRLLLSWWKAANYVFSPDTRLFYRRKLTRLIAGEKKIFLWPEFIKSIHIDAENVNSRKDNPRVWFEYKAGYVFLEEDETNKKSTTTVQSFSTNSATAQTPASKRRRQGSQEEPQHTDETPKEAETLQQHCNRGNRGTPGANASNAGGNETIARTLYETPAADRRLGNGKLIENFIDDQNETSEGDTRKKDARVNHKIR